MKTLKQEVGSLVGREETITMSDLRKQPGDVFDQVALGKSFTVTRAGRVLGKIVPPELNAFELGALVRQMKL